MAFNKQRFENGGTDSKWFPNTKFTVEGGGARHGSSENSHVGGKMNIFGVLDRGIRRDAAKTTNADTAGPAVRDMMSGMDQPATKKLKRNSDGHYE
jgi:hypothetical protein